MVTFDTADAHARLDALAEKLGECRAALMVADEGDPTALESMRATVDAMASDLAVLRTAVGGADLG
ncbi:MAG: hypothetical protein H0V81_01835 [Solirubrobacterales bacterium]|nr:hypothetical protein [Solirubrobacterales bacterium]